MTIIDPYADQADTDFGPYTHAFEVTPDDTLDLPHVTVGLYVGYGGEFRAQMASGDEIVLEHLAGQAFYRIRLAKVFATGTTAGQFVAFY